MKLIIADDTICLIYYPGTSQSNAHYNRFYVKPELSSELNTSTSQKDEKTYSTDDPSTSTNHLGITDEKVVDIPDLDEWKQHKSQRRSSNIRQLSSFYEQQAVTQAPSSSAGTPPTSSSNLRRGN